MGGASASGSLANIVDLSPNHAGSKTPKRKKISFKLSYPIKIFLTFRSGTVLGIIKTLTIIPGVISPLLVTRITSDFTKDKTSQWKNVFIFVSVIYIVCSAIFLAFGSGEVQPWNEEKIKSKEEDGFLEIKGASGEEKLKKKSEEK